MITHKIFKCNELLQFLSNLAINGIKCKLHVLGYCILLVCNITHYSCVMNKTKSLTTFAPNNGLSLTADANIENGFLKVIILFKNNSNKKAYLIYNRKSNALQINQCTKIVLRDSNKKLISLCPFRLVNISELIDKDYTVIESGQELSTRVDIKLADIHPETNHVPCSEPTSVIHGKITLEVLYKDNYLSHKNALHTLESKIMYLNII